MKPRAWPTPSHLILTCVLGVLVAGCARHDAAAGDAALANGPLGLVARGRVDVDGGARALALPVDGLVSEVRVKEGDSVTAGEVLVQVDATPSRLDAALARAHQDQARAQVALSTQRVAATREHARRLAEAARDDAGDRQSADDAREAAAEAVAELDNAKAGVKLADAELQRAEYLVRAHVLRAPVAGQVQRLSAWPGQHASAGGPPLLTLLPSSARIVRAELSQELVDQVRVGQLARILSDDGNQRALARARVERVGANFGQSVLQEDPLQRIDERSVEAVLTIVDSPNDATSGLRVGQRVLVRFDAPPAATERLAKPRAGTL